MSHELLAGNGRVVGTTLVAGFNDIVVEHEIVEMAADGASEWHGLSESERGVLSKLFEGFLEMVELFADDENATTLDPMARIVAILDDSTDIEKNLAEAKGLDVFSDYEWSMIGGMYEEILKYATSAEDSGINVNTGQLHTNLVEVYPAWHVVSDMLCFMEFLLELEEELTEGSEELEDSDEDEDLDE